MNFRSLTKLKYVQTPCLDEESRRTVRMGRLQQCILVKTKQEFRYLVLCLRSISTHACSSGKSE